jgi:integrase
VQNYVTKRLETGAGTGTVNVEVRILKHIVRRAVAWEYLSRNPLMNANGDFVEGLKPLREPPGRVRYLTEDELQPLLAACDGEPYLGAFVSVALNTGMRRSEILSLTRTSIDWSRHTATLAKTKNGDAACVPLNESAMEALRTVPARIDGRLFPLNGPQVTMAFGRAVRRAGIQNFRLHDLRHTFASYHAMGGVHTRGLQVLLRHKSPAMTARYSHLSESYLREAVEKVTFAKSKIG